MKRLSDLQGEIVDTLGRIERLNGMIELHQSQPTPDLLALEGYQRLREQYAHQLEDLLAGLNLRAKIHLNAA